MPSKEVKKCLLVGFLSGIIYLFLLRDLHLNSIFNYKQILYSSITKRGIIEKNRISSNCGQDYYESEFWSICPLLFVRNLGRVSFVGGKPHTITNVVSVSVG